MKKKAFQLCTRLSTRNSRTLARLWSRTLVGLLVLGVLMQSESLLYGGTGNSDVRNILIDGFRKSHGTWAEKTLKESVGDILAMANRKMSGLSVHQATTIADSIRALPHFTVIDENTHPLLKKLAREEALYHVRNYLKFGDPDPDAQQQYLEQVTPTVRKWATEFRHLHRDLEEIISEAERKALEALKQRSENPLLPEGKQAAGTQAFDQALAEWQRERDSFEGQIADSKNRHLLINYIAAMFRRSLRPVLKASYRRMLPRTEAYKVALQEYKTRIREISAWHRKKMHDELKAFRRNIALETFFETERPELERYLNDGVGNIENIAPAALLPKNIATTQETFFPSNARNLVTGNKKNKPLLKSGHTSATTIGLTVIVGTVGLLGLVVAIMLYRRKYGPKYTTTRRVPKETADVHQANTGEHLL